MSATTRRPRGFTLLEIMLALGIFGIVTVTLYGTFARTLRSKALAERQADVTRLGRAAIARMADEIASAYVPANLKDLVFFRAYRSGTDDAPLDSLAFTALSSRPAGLEGAATDQRMLAYFFPRDRSGMRRDRHSNTGAGAEDDAPLERPANRGGPDLSVEGADDYFAAFGPTHPPVLGAEPHRLLRREAAMIERRGLDDAQATVFLEDVASLEYQFYDGNEWRDAWDSLDPNFRRLPRAVRIDLALYDDGGAVHHFATAVDLPLSDTLPPPTSASPSRGAPAPTPTTTPKANQ